MRERYPAFGHMLNGESTQAMKKLRLETQGGAAMVRRPLEKNMGDHPPPINAISLPAGSPILRPGQLLSGYLAEGPAIAYDQYSFQYFEMAEEVSKSLLGDVLQKEVHHDADWKNFPEIGDNLKPCGIEPLGYAAGMCPDLGVWALGLGDNKKRRESAANLALSLAVARDSPHFQKTLQQYPLFYELAARAGLL